MAVIASGWLYAAVPGRMAVTDSGWIDAAVLDALQCVLTLDCRGGAACYMQRSSDALQCVRPMSCRGRCLLDKSVSVQLSYA